MFCDDDASLKTARLYPFKAYPFPITRSYILILLRNHPALMHTGTISQHYALYKAVFFLYNVSKHRFLVLTQDSAGNKPNRNHKIHEKT